MILCVDRKYRPIPKFSWWNSNENMEWIEIEDACLQPLFLVILEIYEIFRKYEPIFSYFFIIPRDKPMARPTAECHSVGSLFEGQKKDLQIEMVLIPSCNRTSFLAPILK
jgi:hypothetical protein